MNLIRDSRDGRSYGEFGKVMGVAASSVNSWERGHATPNTENLAKIAVGAGMTFNELMDYLEGSDDEKPFDYSFEQVQFMPLSAVAKLAHAVAERLDKLSERLEGEIPESDQD